MNSTDIPTDPAERRAQLEAAKRHIEQFAPMDLENEGTEDYPDLTDPRDFQ